MKVTRKKALSIVAAALVAALVFLLSACGGSNGDSVESKQQKQDTTSLVNNQPIPHFNYSQERQNMIDIEIAEAATVETTTFVTHEGNQDPIFSCPSIGFGIPDTASLSNPVQAGGAHGDTPLGQMDPPGVYVPPNSAGTFLICLYSSGQPYINRIEDLTDTAGGPAVWDYAKHRFQLVGAPTAAATGAR